MKIFLSRLIAASIFVWASFATAQEEEPSSCERYHNRDLSSGESPPWHMARSCLRAMRKKEPPMRQAAERADFSADKFRSFVVQIFDAPDIRFYDEVSLKWRSFNDVADRNGNFKINFIRVAQVNDLGQPYNGMGHSGLGMVLYGLADLVQHQRTSSSERDTKFYRKLARAIFNTVLLEKSQNGLSDKSNCGSKNLSFCTWFYSVTRRTAPTGSGATLNQHLHVVRDLAQAMEIVRKNGWESGDDYEQAFVSGLNQLLISNGHQAKNKAPNLSDFLQGDSEGSSTKWAFYGFNPNKQPPSGGYYLKSEEKNRHYHFHSIELFGRSVEYLLRTDIDNFNMHKLAICQSSIWKMLEAADNYIREGDTLHRDPVIENFNSNAAVYFLKKFHSRC